jgi:hypothetical protein
MFTLSWVAFEIMPDCHYMTFEVGFCLFSFLRVLRSPPTIKLNNGIEYQSPFNCINCWEKCTP